MSAGGGTETAMGHGLRALLALVALARVQTGAEVLSFDSIGDQDDTFPTYTSQWSNRSDLVAEVDVVTCRRHSDCGQYEFCFGKVGFGNKGLGICQNFFSETCTAEQPCDVGDGDCDTDFDCVSDLVCGTFGCMQHCVPPTNALRALPSSSALPVPFTQCAANQHDGFANVEPQCSWGLLTAISRSVIHRN